MALLRLDKLLSDTGLASRREAADLIRRGEVTVNGVPVRSGAEKVDPEKVAVAVSGVPVVYQRFTTLMLHKPAGVVSATEDRRERTVLDLLTPQQRALGLFPAGRLDKDATGLLLLTNDGDLAHRVISPKKHVDKIYRVTVSGTLTQDDCEKIKRGLLLPDGLACLPGELVILSPDTGLLRIHEGKFHQVKRMMDSLGKPVTALHRLSIGGLVLDASLAQGQARMLTQEELESVFSGRDVMPLLLEAN